MSDTLSSALIPSFSSIGQELSRWFFIGMADRVVETFEGELNGLGLAGGRRTTTGLNHPRTQNRWNGIRWEMGR
jgi:hypothetical protein